MPIKGISEIIRLPRKGKIRLGIKNEMGNGMPYPSPTDYFVCPEEVKNVFGEKPKELRIMFPTEDETQWASQYLRCYSETRRLICRGDGMAAIARVDINSGEVTGEESRTTELREITCDPDNCIYHRQRWCRRIMNLQFLLPDCPGLGVYQLDTSSFHSMVNINSSLELIRGVCGRVSMIPLSLRLIEQEVLSEGRRKTIRVLSLTAPYSFAEIQKYAQLPPGQSLILPGPDSEAPDDLFPNIPITATERRQISAVPTENLFDLWTRTKSKIMHFEIHDSQIAEWFRKNWHLEVTLNDFEPPVPPEKLTTDMLLAFIDAIDRYTNLY